MQSVNVDRIENKENNNQEYYTDYFVKLVEIVDIIVL